MPRAQESQQLALVVDDDPAGRKVVHRYLRALGLSVLEASDASSALRQLSEITPALICLDVTLPELSGFALQERAHGTPFDFGCSKSLTSCENSASLKGRVR